MRAVLQIAVLAAALAAAGARVAAAEDGKCFADWSTAAPIVRREKLVSAQELHEQARKRHLGEPIRVTLCQEKGRFVYRIVLQDAAGRVTNLTVDARKPF
jgi:uncharacterized membrane protein YkoI